jgi:cytochrome c oxidase subunit 1
VDSNVLTVSSRASAMPAIAPGTPTRLARAWLWLGVMALIGSGLLAVLLVLSRTPGIQDVFPLKDLFRAALVVHVDLSVAVWFMAFAAVIWCALGLPAWPGWAGVAFGLAALGTALMSVSPFFPGAEPVLNNYIPVLKQPLFFVSIWIFGAGLSLTVLRALITTWPQRFLAEPLRLGAFLGAVAAFLSLGAFVWSWAMVPWVEGVIYYEVLFWGGGHTLQFQHALLMVVAWLWIAAQLGARRSRRRARCRCCSWWRRCRCCCAGHLSAGASRFAAAHGAVRQADALGPPLHGAAAPARRRSRCGALRGVPADPAKSALLASFTLFALGGVLGYLIQGVNVVIPAHYHGSTVGVTLAFMGLAYVLLPTLGFGRAEGRMAVWQPYVYGAGQLIHVMGLAWSGGYGVQRKVAGAEQMLTTLPQKVGMGMMGLGGLIAVIGGLMFVLVCLQAMSRRGER